MENQYQVVRARLVNSKNASGQYLAGTKYMNLAKEHTNDFEHYANKALTHFSNAIKLKPTETKYYCERAKVYSSLNLPKKAVDDFKEAKDINIKHPSKDVLSNYHLQNLFEDLITLDNIKSTIQELRSNGSLPKKFLDSYDSLVDVVTNIRVKVSENSEKIKFIMKELQVLGEAIKNGDSTEALQKKFITLAKQVAENTEGVESNMDDIEALQLNIADEIVYDKEILNHPDMLEFLLNNFGDLNNVLSINDLVDPTLITDAKETDDMDLLLAGFNSAVDYDFA